MGHMNLAAFRDFTGEKLHIIGGVFYLLALSEASLHFISATAFSSKGLRLIARENK